MNLGVGAAVYGQELHLRGEREQKRRGLTSLSQVRGLLPLHVGADEISSRVVASGLPFGEFDNAHKNDFAGSDA